MSAVDREWAQRVADVAMHLALLLESDRHLVRNAGAIEADLAGLRGAVLLADTHVEYLRRGHGREPW